MALSTLELIDLAGAPRNPWGELRLIWRLQRDQLLALAVALPAIRPALARAA
jgi:hypothetical protein